MSDNHGKFCWFELMTSDVAGAEAFYGETIGWKTSGGHGAGGDYVMFKQGEAFTAGLMALPEEVAQMNIPPHWMAYVWVEDLEAATEKAASLGGRVLVPPTDIPGSGRFATIADPQGAAIGLFTAEQSTPIEPTPDAHGLFSWCELATSDHAAAWTFYREMFGWKQGELMDMGELGTYRLYSTFGSDEQPGKSSGGMFNMPAGAGMPAAWMVYVSVDDIESAIERVQRMGGRLLSGPSEVPGGDRVAQLFDPQGAAFALHQPAAGQ